MTDHHAAAVASAARTIELELDGLRAIQAGLADLSADGLAAPFAAAVAVLAGAKGRVIVSGIGKSGHVGLKRSEERRVGKEC